ncbi:MAG: HAD family hydrolase, partial [Acutalibacter sp.]
MIRAIFFDIDGTLLDSATGKVPPSTLACLRALQRKGVRLWVATGRFPAMTTFLRDIFPFDGVITLNGQLATDKDGQVLHRMAHEPENIRALVELVRQDPEPFPCLIIEEEQCFSLRESPVIQEHFAWAGLPAPEAYHLSRLEEHPVLQFLAYITPQEYGRLAPLRHIEITGSGH